MTAETISIRTSGLVTVSLVTPEGSRPVASFHNDMQATGRAVVARALYSPAMSLNCMYMLYWSGTPSTIPALTPSSGTITAYDLRNAANYGYVRVPIIQTGLSGEDGNIITLQGITASGAGLNDGASRVFAAALVMAPDPADVDSDILFSVANFIAKVEGVDTAFYVIKAANAQVGVSWQVTIAIGS